MTLSPLVFQQVKLITTAKECWKKLKQMYGENTEAMYDNALEKITTIDLNNFKDLPAYLAIFKEYLSKLDEMGTPLPNQIQRSLFKKGLPSYLKDHMFTLTVHDIKAKKDIDFDSVAIQLEQRVIADYLSERTNESAALRGNHQQYGEKEGAQGGKGGKNTSSPSLYRDDGVTVDHTHEGKPCRHGTKCWRIYRYLAPDSWKEKNPPKKDKEDSKGGDSRNDNKIAARRVKGFPGKANDKKGSSDKSDKSHTVIIDSGDQEHTNWDRSKFKTYTPVSNMMVGGVGGGSYTVQGIGTIDISAIVDGKIVPFELENVRHVPGMDINLLSTTQLDLTGYTHKGGNGEKAFYDNNGNVVLQGYLHDRTYYLDTKWDNKISLIRRLNSHELAKNDASWTEWHCRFGHVSMERTKAIAKHVGVDCEAADRLQQKKPQELCSSCVSGKIHKNPSRIPVIRSTVKGKIWSIDLSMAGNVLTLGGHRYIMTMKDEGTGFVRIIHLRDRGGLHVHLEQELRILDAEDIKVAHFRSDNELLFSAACTELYRKWGIEMLPTVPYNPSQNGVAERLNRTLFSLVRAVLIDSGLPQSFWGEAIYYIVYIINLVPSKRDGKSPYERWFGYEPEGTYLKPFGCLCYSYNISPALKKLDDKAIKCRFLAHEGKSIYRVWDIQGERVLRSAHVIFDEKGTKPYTDDDLLPFEDADPDDYCLYDLPANQIADVDRSEGADQASEEASPSVDLTLGHDGDDAQQQEANASDVGGVRTPTSPGQASEEEFHSADEPESSGQSDIQRRDDQIGDLVIGQVERSMSNDAPVQITKGPSSEQESGPGKELPEGQPKVTRKKKDWGPATRQSTRTNPRLNYSKIHKDGIGTGNNQDGFVARLTRAITDTHQYAPLPSTVDEALSGGDADEWQKSLDSEMENHYHQRTFERPCKPPPGTKIVKTRWVLAYKKGPMGEITKRKARWVAKGFSQQYGIDFDETFSSTLK